jgi:hypothetical protein
MTQCAAFLKRKYKLNVGNVYDDKSFLGITWNFASTASAIWIRTNKTRDKYIYNATAHEVTHAVVNILLEHSIKLTEESQETYAYLMGYVCEHALPFVMKSKAPHKKENTGTGGATDQ